MNDGFPKMRNPSLVFMLLSTFYSESYLATIHMIVQKCSRYKQCIKHRLYRIWRIPHPTGMRLNKKCLQACFVKIFPQHSLCCGKPALCPGIPEQSNLIGRFYKIIVTIQHPIRSRLWRLLMWAFRGAPRLVRPLDFREFQMKSKLSIWNSRKSRGC